MDEHNEYDYSRYCILQLKQCVDGLMSEGNERGVHDKEGEILKTFLLFSGTIAKRTRQPLEEVFGTLAGYYDLINNVDVLPEKQ